MALVSIREITPSTRLGIWKMDEPFEGSPRERERKSVEWLLHAMTGSSQLSIVHEPSGKPFLEASPYTISISHTRGFAVLLLSEGERVGVDIEYRSDRVERIAHRFIRPDEEASDTDQKLLIWSAKEAVYKLYSEDNLLFHDMRTCHMADGQLRMENLKRGITVDVSYEFTDDYVLTYAVLPAQLA